MRSRLLVLACLIAGILMIIGCDAKSAESNNGAGTGQKTEEASTKPPSPYDNYEGYLLEGYPEDVVPLYESLAIDTCYYSVRNDPQWRAVEGGLRNFYHVVYLTDKTDKEVLEHYRGLMSDINPDVTSDTTIEGMIDGYKVWINTTVDDETTVYMSVDLNQKTATENNPFYTDYPQGIASLEPKFKRFEHKYQVGSNGEGEIRYEEYYETPISAKKFDEYCRDTFGAKDSFTAEGNGLYKWIEGDYRVTMAYAADHKRTYVTIAKDMP